MGSYNPLILLSLVILVLIISHSGQAQNIQQEFLDAHNAARAQVGVAPMVWDANVAAYALAYANRVRGQCLFQHSGGRYGENLAMSSGGLTARDAVGLWVSERRFYNYQSNTCASGQVCGHYTQVVWRNSVRLGCARVRCNNGNWYVICNYDPPGNWRGQRPY
ncbi:hypothetical protein BUALT_Bualt17G0090900 [Buddleja alternifolia]|uniref:SCP domain-containing protein n=1 Tax=Buddleja alternifolia TaxID=168488 RepID=A0AAV6WFL2_9LAMI|nr:hypothetical protein BUALT_Bualt17G0090900 [Buddleja alternifolia]